MQLIVGLGNPGTKYQKNRHNVGFLAIEALAKQEQVELRSCRRTRSERTSPIIKKEKIMLAKPQTFMNNSGQSVALLLRYYKIKPQDLWVISDDVDLPLGKIRSRDHGSAGGHRGVQSIIDTLKTEKFNRIRIGIGSNREHGIPSEQYVLQNFTAPERKIINETITTLIATLPMLLKKKQSA